MLLSLLFCLVHSWLSTIENWTSEQTVCKVCYSINHFQNPCAACYSPISSLSPDIKPVPNILLIVVDAPLQFLWSFAPVIKYHLLPVKLELNSTQHAKIIAKKKKKVSHLAFWYVLTADIRSSDPTHIPLSFQHIQNSETKQEASIYISLLYHEMGKKKHNNNI